MSGDMLVVEVCRIFGWDYFTYYAQPTDFLDLIHRKLEIDGKKREAEDAKAKAAQNFPTASGRIR